MTVPELLSRAMDMCQPKPEHAVPREWLPKSVLDAERCDCDTCVGEREVDAEEAGEK